MSERLNVNLRNVETNWRAIVLKALAPIFAFTLGTDKTSPLLDQSVWVGDALLMHHV